MRIEDLRGCRIAVWGLGVEGRAALARLPDAVAPAELVAVEDRADPPPDLPTGVRLVCGDAGAVAEALAAADAVVASPGVSRYRPEAVALRERGAYTSGTALLLADRAGSTLAVTGSKGKSTTTKLAHHLLAALLGPAVRVGLGGNLGRAPIELLTDPEPPDRLVLEVSSFQAAEVRHRPAVGILTALFPDHLDWHGSLERYLADKLNLFRGEGSEPFVAVDGGSALVLEVAAGLPGAVLFGVPGGWHVDDAGVVRRAGAEAFPLSASPLVGAHNARNLCAVLTALDGWGLDPLGRTPEVVEALARFAPLPHRLEVAGEVDGVTCVDDSMSSNPDAAIAAIGAFPGRPLTILLGGADRGLAYDSLAAALVERAAVAPTTVVHVPVTGRAMAGAVSARPGGTAVRLVEAGDLAEAVSHGRAHTPPGGVLLLSPGAPSFVEFRDYKARAAAFRRLLGLPPAAAEL